MQSADPLISVVIPTLNTRKDFLHEAMTCIQGQTLQPREIIIVNNGHGDVVFPDISLSVRIFNTVYRAGVAQARNIGVSLAKTEYVSFLDDDDLWAKDYLEGMARRIETEAPDCLIGRLDQLIDGRILPYKNADGLLKKDVILVRNPGITGSSVVVKKDSFLKAGGYNTKLPPSEDKTLVLEFLSNGFKVVAVPECQAILRQHGKENRLTASRSMAEGIYQFYRHYKAEMSLYQRAFNLFKIHKYRWETKRTLANLMFYAPFYLLFLSKTIVMKFSKSS